MPVVVIGRRVLVAGGGGGGRHRAIRRSVRCGDRVVSWLRSRGHERDEAPRSRSARPAQAPHDVADASSLRFAPADVLPASCRRRSRPDGPGRRAIPPRSFLSSPDRLAAARRHRLLPGRPGARCRLAGESTAGRDRVGFRPDACGPCLLFLAGSPSLPSQAASPAAFLCGGLISRRRAGQAPGLRCETAAS